MARAAPLYRTIWRWHFYAGLLVMPFILILSISGAIYLFKPQIDRWEERDFRGLSIEGAVSPDRQLAAALAANPGAAFHAYRLPQEPGDAAMIRLARPGGEGMVDVFVSPQGKVLGSLDPETRIAPFIARFHGSLMIGRLGDWLVELAASWAIVLILTGLYLWWPEGRGVAGVLWPRLHLGGRAALRDLHAVTGFWVSGLALVLLLTGLPWASVWGDAFRLVRTELGLLQGPQDWKTGSADPHAEHNHKAMASNMAHHATGHAQHQPGQMLLTFAVAKARGEHMAFPVLVLPPGAQQAFGPPTGNVWTVKSETQNRPLVRSVSYDPVSGREVARQGFADKHPIDRVVNYGIAWHEGQLLGPFNQVVGVLTALMLVTLAVSGFIMWRRRKPDGLLGAPPPASAKARGVAAIVLLLAALLPMLAASLIVLWVVERLVLSRVAPAARWLGLAPPPISR
jgi:uncharacterized iron-regulated membrane protein